MCDLVKGKLIFFCLLMVITAGSLAFVDSLHPLTAHATYVEGNITQDTVWTLMDSPFVLSKNTTVWENSTLTVEPGVEVRFGGEYALIVEGGLSAIGEENSTITFTSNREEPYGGDWSTIVFKGAKPSTMAYCIVEYGENGITLVDSTVELKNNEIAYNLESGIYITGDNQVTMQNNTLDSNKNGILLTGDLTAGVNITENLIMSNTQSGIQLDAGAYSNLVILDNILSANENGFYVTGQASTYITMNSISYNTIGILYAPATQMQAVHEDHVAYYNDIYGNIYGMDVSDSFNAQVNAVYNYWGDESGPYHTSLNPFAKGNPVGGDGANLDFIFFLTAPIGYINKRPTARLLTDKTLAPPNQAVTFIATTSSDDRRVDEYLYDYGDGSNSGWITLSIFSHKYLSTGTYNVSLTVMDDFGVTSNNVETATIGVQDLNPLDVTIIPGHSRIGAEEHVSVTVHVTNGTSNAENAAVTLFSVRSGNFTPSSGLTNPAGYFTTTFIAPNVTQTTNVRITVTASKSGYADGSDYRYLVVLPALQVQVTPNPSIIYPDVTSQVTAHVTYNEQPVANAEVRVWSDSGGNFSAETGITNSNGNAAFTFTAPQTTTQLNVTITAAAAKTGFADSEGQTEITVLLGILNIQITTSPTPVESETSSNITVYVTYDTNPIADVEVRVWSDSGGNFSAETGITNSNGNAAFTFTAPQTTTQLNLNINATATKSGYTDGEAQRVLIVIPEPVPEDGGTGMPITTILLIAIPIIVVALVVTMIKLKIIYLAPE